MNATTDPCCAHRGLDHATQAPAARCTMPGCRCPGWRPRENKGKAPRLEDRAKCVELWNQGLTAKVIAGRVGVSISTVSHAVREAGVSTGGRRHRNDCPTIHDTPRRCEVLPARRTLADTERR